MAGFDPRRGHMHFPRKGNKYGAQQRTYKGVSYPSIREAKYAEELDIRVMAGDLKEWRRQIPFDLVVNGVKICRYTIDFLEIDSKGNETYTEVKGYATRDWKLRWKLFEALYPELEKRVVT